MGDNKVIVISSDEEDEKTLWKTMGTDVHFQKLFKKVKRIIFNQTKRSYVSNGFPYGRFVEFTQALGTVLPSVVSKNTQRFIWRCVVRWLVPLKNCIREPTPLMDDWKYNYIVTDIMAQYINFKCEYYYERDPEIVQEQIEEIIRMLEVAFSCKTEFVLITFLKIKIRFEYRNILIPLFRAYLISPLNYDATDFCNYICLVLCYRQWKRLIHIKESRETINEYACGQIKRLMGTHRPIDLTLNPVLPWEVPKATQKSAIFFKLHSHLTTAREVNNGTRLLLASVWRDWQNTLRKFIRLYEEYNGFIVRLEPEIRTVKLRHTDTNSDDDDVILISNDDAVIVIPDDDELPNAGGSISNMNHLKMVEKLKRLAEETPPKSLEEQEKTEKALQNLQCRCGAGKQGTTMAVNQHLSKVCDISSLSKILGFSNLRSLSIQLSVYLSVFKNKKGDSCNCRYLGSSFNENNVCIVFDTTDEDRDDDDNYFVRDEVTNEIDDDFAINDLVDKEVLGQSSNDNEKPAKQTPAAVAAVIAELKRRALEMGTQIDNRRPTTPIVLSSDDDEPVIVEPPVAVQEVNQNNAIVNEIVLSSSEDEAGEMEVVSPRLTPPPMENVEERPLRREKTRCITGEVSSTTSLGCSGARNTDSVSTQNENILENAREVGTLSAVRTVSPSGNGLSIVDYSDISDDDLDICLAPRQRWSKFSKVVEEATSSTSELPIRVENETASDNVIFSVPCSQRRRSSSSSPCHTRTNSPTDNSRLITPSSTFRSRRMRRYRVRHSRIPVRKCRTVSRSIDDSELPTCSRYLRHMPISDKGSKNQMLGLENCKHNTDSQSHEEATCSRYVQKKTVTQNVDGETERSNDKLESEQSKSPELTKPTAARSKETVNIAVPFESSTKEGEQTPPVSEDVNSDLNKLMEDITNFIETPVCSDAVGKHPSKSTEGGREQENLNNLKLKKTEVVEGRLDLVTKRIAEVSLDADVERNTMNSSPNACRSKNNDENAFILEEKTSEQSYFLKMHKSASICEESEVRKENFAQKSELALNMEDNKSQCSISARIFGNSLNENIFPDNNDDITYLREERRHSLEHSPLSSVENDFLVEEESSCLEADNDDDIESPAYEPIVSETHDKVNDELRAEDNKTAEETIRPSTYPDVTVPNSSCNVMQDLLSAATEEAPLGANSTDDTALGNTVLVDVDEHLTKQSFSTNDITTYESIAIHKTDLTASRISKEVHDLDRDIPLHKGVQVTKAPIDLIDNSSDTVVSMSEAGFPTGSAVTDNDMNNHLLQKNESLLEIPTCPPILKSTETDTLTTTESAIDYPNIDISVVYEDPSAQSSLTGKELFCTQQTMTEQCQSNFENSSENPLTTADINQSNSGQGIGGTNEHANKSVSVLSSEMWDASCVETESEHASSEIETTDKSTLTDQSTLTPSDSVEISAKKTEGPNDERPSDLASNENTSLGEENGDKKEQKSSSEFSEKSETTNSTAVLSIKGCSPTSPNNIDISASSENLSQKKAVSTIVPDGSANEEEQNHLNSNDTSIENASVPGDTTHVEEIKLQQKCDEVILSDSVNIIGDVESLPSLCASESNQSNQETGSKKPPLNTFVQFAAVLFTNKYGKEKPDDILKGQGSSEKAETFEVSSNENAPTDLGELVAIKSSLPIQISDSSSDITENVEILTETSSDQKITSHERTSSSSVSADQPFESVTHSDEQCTSTVVHTTTIHIANKLNILEFKQNKNEIPPQEDNETSSPQADDTEIQNEHQELLTNNFNVETEVDKLLVSAKSPSFESNDTLTDNEIQLESKIKSAASVPNNKQQDSSDIISKEIIEDLIDPTPNDDAHETQSHNVEAESSLSSEKIFSEDGRSSNENAVSETEYNSIMEQETVQNIANVSENLSNAELSAVSLVNEVKDLKRNISNDQMSVSPSSAVLSREDDTLVDRKKQAKNEESEKLMDEMDCLSKDPDDFSENTCDEYVSRENPCNHVALKADHVQPSTESPSKDSIRETEQNGFPHEHLSANVESVIKGVEKGTKCDNVPEISSTHDQVIQDQSIRNVTRAAKQILSIEDYAMVKSFQNVATPLAKHCNAHLTTVPQTPNLNHDPVVDEIQTNPQTPARVLGACQEQHKDNTPADYSTKSQTFNFSNKYRTSGGSIRYKKKQSASKETANYANCSVKRCPMYKAELNRAQHLKNEPRSIQGINIEKNLEVNRNIISLTQQLRNSPFTAITSPSDAMNAMRAKFLESKRQSNEVLHFDPRNPNMCMQPRYRQLCNDRCCAPKMLPNGPAYPNSFRCNESSYNANHLPVGSVPFVNQRTEKDNFKDFTWPRATAGISKNRQLQLCTSKSLEVMPCNKNGPYFVPEKRCAPLLQGVLEDSTYRTHMGRVVERISTSIPEPMAKQQEAPVDSFPCIDYSKRIESPQKMTNEGKSHRMNVESGAELKPEGNVPSFNNWCNEAEIQFLFKLRQPRNLDVGEDSNQSIQVQVAAEDLGDPLSVTGFNSPAYGCETPYRETSTDCNSNTVTDPAEDLADEEVSTITSQEVSPATYNTYNDDCGTPVMDEKDAEEVEGSPCQGKIVSLSVLKQIPELPSLPSNPTGTSIIQNQCDFAQRSINNLPRDCTPNCCSVIGCPDASENVNPINMTNASKDKGSLYDNLPANSSQVNSNSEFIEPSPKPKPTIDIDSEYQKTPLKMRIKRRISQCGDINEAFHLSPSESLKPIDILATQALERQHNESILETGVDSLDETPVNSICNYPTDLSLRSTENTPEQEKDQNLLYQESWYKKLGKTKTIDKTPNQQYPNPMFMSNTQCTSDNSDALAMLQLSGNHLNATSSTAVEDTPLSAKNEGRRRKPIRVRKLTDIYDRDNIRSESDMSTSGHLPQPIIHPTTSACHSVFTYPAVVPPQQPVETTMPLQPLSVLETTYNPEDIKAAAILSDMLKTSYKIDESLKFRLPKTQKARKTNSPRSNKETSLQFRRMTRSTSHLMEKLPSIDTTNTLQLILPTTSPQLPPVEDSLPVADLSCTNTIWQQDRTKEILRSLTAQTAQETDKAIPCLSGGLISQKPNTYSLSSSDSDDVGRLIIDMDAGRSSPSAAVQSALEKSTAILPKTCEVHDMTNGSPTANRNEGRNFNSFGKLPPVSSVEQPQNVKNVSLNSPEYEVSALYPIVQLTEFTPKSKSKRGPRKTGQPRSYVRQNGRRILNSPKASADKQNTKACTTAKSRKSPASRAGSKATKEGNSAVEAKTVVQVVPSQSSSELSASDSSPPETPDKILPFSVAAILGDCKSSPQKPTAQTGNPSQVEMEPNSQDFWLKAFLLMRKSPEEVSSEPKQKPIQETSTFVKETKPLSDGAATQDLKAIPPQTVSTSADKTCRRKKALLPTRKMPKSTSKSLIDTEVNKSEEDSSVNKVKQKNVQPKDSRKKCNRTTKPIISTNDSQKSELTEKEIQIKQKSHPEIQEELAVVKETESNACEIKATALNDPALENAATPTVGNPLLVCQKVKKSKSVEDIVARLSKTVKKSNLMSIQPEVVETAPAPGEASTNGTKQQEPNESDIVNCEGTKHELQINVEQPAKTSPQVGVIADENEHCEEAEQVLACSVIKSKSGRRKSEKRRSLEIIIEDKMDQLNQTQKTKPTEIDSPELTPIQSIPLEGDKLRNRWKSHKEVENKNIESKQTDQVENAALTEHTPPAAADKPKRRRSSNKKVENKMIESKEQANCDVKSVALVTHKSETNPCQSSDEQIEITLPYRKETKALEEDKTVERDEIIEKDSFEIHPMPVERDKLRNRRKSHKEVENKDIDSKQTDQVQNAAITEHTSPVVVEKPKRHRSPNKEIGKEAEGKSAITKNKKKICYNSEEQIESSDKKETKSPREDKTVERDEPVEDDTSGISAIQSTTVEAARLRHRRKSHKEVENKDIDSKQLDQSENSSIAEPTSSVVADKLKHRRSSSKKIENQVIESKEEGVSVINKNKTKLCHNSGDEKLAKALKADKTVEQDEAIENDSSDISAIHSTTAEAAKLRNRRKSHKEVENKDIDSKQLGQSENSSIAEPTSPVIADKVKRLRSSSKKIENQLIESKEEGVVVINRNKTKLCHNSGVEKGVKATKGDKTVEQDEAIENDSSDISAIHSSSVEAAKLRNRRKSHKEVENKDIDSTQLDQSENSSKDDHTCSVVVDKLKRRRSTNKTIENQVIESKEEGKSATSKNKTKLCYSSDEQIESNDEKETQSPREDKTVERDEPVENDTSGISAIQSTTVEAAKLRHRRKSHKQVDNRDIDSQQLDQSENSSIAKPTSPVVADKPKRRRSSNKRIENQVIESKEDVSVINKNKTKLSYNSDEQIASSDEKGTKSPREDKIVELDEPVENDTSEISAIHSTTVEATKLRHRRKSHKEVENKDIDSTQLDQLKNSSIPEYTTPIVDKPKRRQSSNKQMEYKMNESREEGKSDEESVTIPSPLVANNNTTDLCDNPEEKMEHAPENTNDKEENIEITSVETVEGPPSPVEAEKIIPDKSNRKQNDVCKSSSMPNVEVEKCHLKRKCIMEIRRLSIDENNLKMTLSKSKEIVEKHSKHAKKHFKRARRLSAEMCDIRRSDETERKVKTQIGLCNEDKLVKMIKSKHTDGTLSIAKSTTQSVDSVVACETASIAEAEALETMDSSLNAGKVADVNNSSDVDCTNLDVSNEEMDIESKSPTKAAENVRYEDTNKLPQSASIIDQVENSMLSSSAPVDELSLKVVDVNEKPSTERKSGKSLKRPAPKSQKENNKAKRRRVEDVTVANSEDEESVESIVEEHATDNIKISESRSDTDMRDSPLGVFKIVRSTVSHKYKPGPKSRKRLNSQHTTDRKRLVVLLRKIKPVKTSPEEAVSTKNNVQIEQTKSGKNIQRRSLDCDNSRPNSATSLRLRSKSTDMKRSPGDQQSRKLKPFKLNISKLEACHKTLKEMNSTEPTTRYEAKLYDESERLAEQLNSFIKKILEDSEDSSTSMLLTNRPQIFDRVPKDIFAGNGDVSDNIGAKYYSPILTPKPYDIILKSKPSEDGHLKSNSVDEKEKIKPRSDDNEQESENEDSENANNSDGNSAPDLELDASEMPQIPDVGIICEEDSIPDLCAEAECLSEVLDEKINKEQLDANIDTSTPFIRDYMISGNYRSNNYLDLSLLPEFEGISLLGVQNQFKNDNSDGDGLLVPKVENLADVEIDFGSELFLYSGCIQSQDSSGSSSDEKREQECETPTPAVDSYLNPTETASRTTANASEIVTETITDPVIQDTNSTSNISSQSQPPPVEVSSEVGFESYNELLAESNPFFLQSEQNKHLNGMSESETQLDTETASPNKPEDISNNPTKEIIANETGDKSESFSVEKPISETESGNSTPTGKEVGRDSVVDTKDLPAKIKRDRIKVLPIESLKPEEICGPVKLKSRPIPFWKIKKVETKTTSESVSEENKTTQKSVVKETPKTSTPPISASALVPEFSLCVGQPVERVDSLPKETIVVLSESSEERKYKEAREPCEKPLEGTTEGVTDDSNKAKATQLIAHLPELNEIVENKDQLNQNNLIQSSPISQLPELNDTVENKTELETTHASNSSKKKQIESIQTSQLPQLNEIANIDHTYTSNPQLHKLPELNLIPESKQHLDIDHTSNTNLNTNTNSTIETLQNLEESNRFAESKYKLGSRHSSENPSKKIRKDTASKLSIDDLFDRLKRESPVNPLMHKVKYTLHKTASFDTDDNSSRDSSVGLVTVPESPHPVISSESSPVTFVCESPLPISGPSMPIISTPRHDSYPEGSTRPDYNTKTSRILATAKSSPVVDMHPTENNATYITSCPSNDLKRPHPNDIEKPDNPSTKILIKETDSTASVVNLEHVRASKDCGGSQKSNENIHKADKNLERLKKSSSVVTTPVSSPKHDTKPSQRVHFSSEIIEIPKVDLLLSASKARTESPQNTLKPVKSILVSQSKHSVTKLSETSISRKGKHKISENNSLDHSSPISDSYATSSQKVNSKSSPYSSSRADRSVTPKTSHTSKSQTSTDVTENNRHKKLICTTSNHSQSSKSTEIEMLIISLTAEIGSISNTLKRLPEPKTYAQHNYRKHTREMYEQKVQHLHELKKRLYKETEKQNQAQTRAKSYSERLPFDSSSNYKGSAQSSHRETKERDKESRRKYENKFAELGTKHFHIAETRVSNCRESKRSPAWDVKQISADEIIADLKMKKSRRN